MMQAARAEAAEEGAGPQILQCCQVWPPKPKTLAAWAARAAQRGEWTGDG